MRELVPEWFGKRYRKQTLAEAHDEYRNMPKWMKETKRIESQSQFVIEWEIFLPTKGMIPHAYYVFLGTTRHRDGRNIMVGRNPGHLAMSLAIPFISKMFFSNVRAWDKKEFQIG